MRTKILAVLSLTASVACATTDSGASGGPDGGWLEPSPILKQQIEDQIARLPWTHGLDRVDQIEWFARVGEPAYSRLLELCADPRPDVAAAAVASLGASGDSRLVEPLHSVEWAQPTDRELTFERARALLRLGDYGEIGVLIDGLEDETLWARAWCLQSLREATNQDLGFDPKGEPEARAAAIARWREWRLSRQREAILPSR
jgi:hypothetical protein